MFEHCLNEAERFLASDKDVIVSVKKVWMQVGKHGKKQGFDTPSLADFTAMLEADMRFEFMSSQPPGDGMFKETVGKEQTVEEAEMESLGFYSGDRVKLRSIELTPELIGDLIRRKVDMTMHALTQAWEKRPTDDQEAEDQLLEILAKTQKLQREVKETFSDNRMKELSTALKKTKKKPSPKKSKNPSVAKTRSAQKKNRPKKRTPSKKSTRGKKK